MQLAGQDADLLDELAGVAEVGADLEVEEPGDEEGAAEVVDELPYLLRLHGDEDLVPALLPVLLLEHDARHPPRLPLLGCDALARLGPGGREDRLGVFWIGPGEAGEVLELNRGGIHGLLRRKGGGGRPRERPEVEEGS